MKKVKIHNNTCHAYYASKEKNSVKTCIETQIEIKNEFNSVFIQHQNANLLSFN